MDVETNEEKEEVFFTYSNDMLTFTHGGVDYILGGCQELSKLGDFEAINKRSGNPFSGSTLVQYVFANPKLVKLVSKKTSDYILPKPNEEVNNALINFGHFLTGSKEEQIIYETSGLPLPPCPSLNIIRTSPFLLDLPAEIGSNNRPDLRLLDGDLDDPNAKSEVVTLILRKLQLAKDRNFCNPQLILSGSGVGKTKALFDMLKEKYGVLIDCTHGNEGQDIKDMYERIGILVTINQKYLEKYCSYEVQLTVIARLVVLSQYILQGVIKQPREWLFTQMNGLASSHYVSCLEVVRKYLRFNIPFEKSQLFSSIMRFIGKIINDRLLIVVDEANYLLDMHANVFNSLRDPLSSPCRSLFTLITSVLVDLPNSVLLVAGTRLELKETELWQSLVAKLGSGSGITPEVIYDLPLADTRRSQKLICRLFQPNYQKEALFLLEKYLPGLLRKRFITTWVDTYVPNTTTLELSIQQFVEDLIHSDNVWSLKSMINNFVKRHGISAHNLFCELVVHYLVDDGIIKDTTTAQWMAGGFCRLIKLEGSYTYKIDEVSVIVGVLYYLKTSKISLSEYFVLKVLATYDPSSAGVLMDSLVALCFYELGPNSGFLKNFEGWDKSHATSIIRIKKREDTLIQPLIMSSWQTTQHVGRSVDERQVKKNYKTTDLANLNIEDDEKLCVLENLCVLPPQAIIRIHIVLPRAPRNSKNFSSGLREICCSQTFEIPNRDPLTLDCTQYSFDVDESNIHTCGLFSKTVCDVLLSIYPNVNKE